MCRGCHGAFIKAYTRTPRPEIDIPTPVLADNRARDRGSRSACAYRYAKAVASLLIKNYLNISDNIDEVDFEL